jgi:integral membrane protein (TIGR01906 family)
LTGFEAAWDRFHRIAFRNDLWQLDPERDRLLQMFPEPFWEDMTYLLGIMTVAEALVILAISLGYLVKDRKPRPRSVAELRPSESAISEAGPIATGTEPRA